MIRQGMLWAVVAATATSLPAADWPQWRGPERDGKSAETGLLKNWERQPPELQWMVEGMGRGYASLAVADGRLYTTGDVDGDQVVVAADARTGELLWRQVVTPDISRHGYPGSRCTPTVDGDRLYVLSSAGDLACLEVAGGAIVWKRNVRDDFGGRMMSHWGFSESVLVDGDRVICTPGADDAVMVALNKANGEEIWRTPMQNIGRRGKSGAGYSSIVVSHAAGVKQYVQLVGQGVIGVRADDGEFLWGYNRVANGTANIPTPIVTGDYVFASTGYRTGAALLKLSAAGDGVDAEEVYFLEATTFQNHHGGMILVDGHVYAGHQHKEGFPICIELETGKVVWGGRIRGAGEGSAAISYVDGQLLFRYQNGTLALIEATPEGYELNGTLTPEYQEAQSWSHPVVVDGLLYLREQDKLMCYSLRDS